MLRHLAPFLAIALLACPAALGQTGSAPISEAMVKAAFVYNFSKFVDWPEDRLVPQNPLRVCLQGARDPFLSALAEIDGKTAQGHQIKVQRANLADLRACQILAIGESERRQLPEILRLAQEANVLTVSELEGFLDEGGIIGLVVNNERVQFEVNLETARRHNLKLSSQLLKLARKVRR